MKKQRWEESEKRRAEKRRSDSQRRERVRRKKMQVRKKGRKVAKHYVFAMICGAGGSKGGLAKAVGAEPCGQLRDEKLHAIVARSTCRSQKCKKKLTGSEHFWKVRCWKSARRYGEKRFWKSKCRKHSNVGPLLEDEMSKKCTPLWCEALIEVTIYKVPQPRSTFGSWNDEKVHGVVAQRTFPSQNVESTSASEQFWKLRYWKSERRCGAKHISKSKC